MNILIIGHARHGKDTVAGFLDSFFGLKYESSSHAAARIFLFDALKEKYGYKTLEECYEDRVNHRAEWYDLICEFNKEDPARLAKEIMKDSNIYCGMRSRREIQACLKAGVFDLVVGVYRPGTPLESEDSFDIDIWKDSDFVIPNSGTENALGVKIIKTFKPYEIELKAKDNASGCCGCGGCFAD